jgi:hypothetical protein
MSLIALPDSQLQPACRKLPGTAHRGPEWKSAVSVLRAAIRNAVEQVDWTPSDTVNGVGTNIIDLIDELDSPSLHVLGVAFGILVRQSRKGDH